VQAIGGQQVVYLVDPREPGRFTERPVRVGSAVGDGIEILSGLEPGDVVVSAGSFFVRAERERLGPRRSTGAIPAPESRADQGPQAIEDVHTVSVVIGPAGYQPARISARVGVPLRIVFTRTTDKACGSEVVIRSLGIRRTLPLNEPVAVEFVPERTGTVAFACEMNMLHGTVVVQ
jgi:hypothetical protein